MILVNICTIIIVIKTLWRYNMDTFYFVLALGALVVTIFSVVAIKGFWKEMNEPAPNTQERRKLEEHKSIKEEAKKWL